MRPATNLLKRGNQPERNNQLKVQTLPRPAPRSARAERGGGDDGAAAAMAEATHETPPGSFCRRLPSSPSDRGKAAHARGARRADAASERAAAPAAGGMVNPARHRRPVTERVSLSLSLSLSAPLCSMF